MNISQFTKQTKTPNFSQFYSIFGTNFCIFRTDFCTFGEPFFGSPFPKEIEKFFSLPDKIIRKKNLFVWYTRNFLNSGQRNFSILFGNYLFTKFSFHSKLLTELYLKFTTQCEQNKQFLYSEYWFFFNPITIWKVTEFGSKYSSN